MFDQAFPIIVFAAAGCCWLVAGVFFAFSDFIMRSLDRLPTAEAVAAMRCVNVVVYRSAFMVGLFAMAGASALFLGLGAFGVGASPLLTAAGAFYLVAVMGVTAFANVPMNKRLADLDLDPASPEAAQVWRRYLERWTEWNHLRTLGATAAAALTTMAAFGL